MMLPTSTMGSTIEELHWAFIRGIGVMCTSQGLIPRAHAGPQSLINRALDGLRCDALMVPESDRRSTR